MTYPNSNPLPDSESSPASGFNSQSQMGLAEVLQMCCLSRRSGQITFRSGESYGFVFIQHGKVLHAMCGPIEGEPAIYTMLTWPGGGFSLNEDILPHKKTVSLSWEQLLFEGARQADEGLSPRLPTGPIVTALPTTARTQENQPKLSISRPDLPAMTYELAQEFTHAGRNAGNDLVLPYPSISGRHCVFIQSGTDVVIRDLNSSNGTLVNGEPINEVVLSPGDQIQIGVVEIKFEAGIKRPKLSNQVPTPRVSTEALKGKVSVEPLMAHQTVRLPSQRTARPAGGTSDDQSFVSGQAAISYEHLAKPEEPKKGPSTVVIILALIGLAVVAAACYFVFLRG